MNSAYEQSKLTQDDRNQKLRVDDRGDGSSLHHVLGSGYTVVNKN